MLNLLTRRSEIEPVTQSLARTRNLGKNGKHLVFTPRDQKILHFLWRWKLASTATIHEVIGRPLTPYSTYKALERLTKHKFIESRSTFEQNFSSWVLTDRGFESIRGSLGDLCEEGYGSENHWHDRNVLAFQLGEWATYQIPMVTHFTEQEMRRRAVDYYPSWVPNSKGHRPDGYTRIKAQDKDSLLAFEVEIWAKSLSTYETTLRFYDLIKKINRVYWLVGDSYAKDQICRAKDCIRDTSQNFHVFVDLQEYMKSGWDAVVTNERSENLGSLRRNMQELCGDIYGNNEGIKWGKSSVSVHYDTKKVLGKKRT